MEGCLQTCISIWVLDMNFDHLHQHASVSRSIQAIGTLGQKAADFVLTSTNSAKHSHKGPDIHKICFKQLADGRREVAGDLKFLVDGSAAFGVACDITNGSIVDV
jgi:hypothetical protein